VSYEAQVKFSPNKKITAESKQSSMKKTSESQRSQLKSITQR
jgi:hypothetical protein